MLNSFTPGTFHVSVNVLHTYIHVLYYNILTYRLKNKNYLLP